MALSHKPAQAASKPGLRRSLGRAIHKVALPA
jgi:hypothetical protein